MKHLIHHKGRGALTNPGNRFESWQKEHFDDGWDSLDEALTERPVRELTTDFTKKIIARNQSPDVPFEQSINPYRGCEHGCVYCFARPTHAYLGFSPGLDFETRLTYKPNAAELLKKELAAKSYVCKPITLGINTDAYQPVERHLGITREILEVLSECRHPVSIVTKSALIERDLDILVPMAEQGLVSVMVSVTTLKPELARVMEPRAAAPHRRLQIIEQLRAHGIPVGVLLAPVIPVLNDSEMEDILKAVKNARAQTAGYVLLRLPHEVKDLFSDWLQVHFPGMAEHVLNRIRDSRGGKLYDAGFGTRMKGEGLYADLLSRRFGLALKQLSFPGMKALNEGLFSPPILPGSQMPLF